MKYVTFIIKLIKYLYLAKIAFVNHVLRKLKKTLKNVHIVELNIYVFFFKLNILYINFEKINNKLNNKLNIK